MDMAFARQVFIEETEELLALVASALLDEVSGEPKSQPQIGDIFRAVHTIKGSSALFGFSALVTYCHELENLLQQVRDGERVADQRFCYLLFDAYTYLQQQLALLQQGGTPTADTTHQQQLARFQAFLGQEKAPVALETDAAEPLNDFRIVFNYCSQLFVEGAEPAEHIRFLQEHGTVTDIRLTQDFPATYDATLCYLRLTLQFQTNLNRDDIQAMFRLLPAGTDLQICAISEPAAISPDIKPRLAEQNVAPLTQKSETVFLKVEAKKLDSLINLIGELITQGAAADLQLNQQHYDGLIETFSSMQKLMSDIRESALSLRMLPVADTFKRMQHLAWELGQTLDKQVTLQIVGAETELDKGMLDKLTDPLLHLVRNAVDHGIETTAERLAQGKKAVGTLRLSAGYEAGAVLIRLADDGAGINVEKVRKKALASGLLTAEQTVDDEALYQLLFTAGFSTAKVVSNVSGRGVGLDVVKRNIDALRGQIYVKSEPRKGSVFEIRLPLTLSIIEGFMCQAGDMKLVLPQSMIQECLEFEAQTIRHQGRMLVLRNELVALIDLSEMLGFNSAQHVRKHLIIVQYGPARAAVLVDELYGELQAVVKPLHPLFRPVKALSGTTLLNDGSVGFMLDIPALMQLAAADEKAQVARVQQKESIDE